MQEMLYPTSFIKCARPGQSLRTDHRRSLLRWYLGISVGHISPEAAAGGLIGLVEDGDRIIIDVNEGLLQPRRP